MTVEAQPAQAFSHSGKFFDVLGLALKNAFLSIISLTLYRFWARTSMRRRVWSRVWIMGDPLEYTGKAGELVRGFLIAVPTFFLPAVFVFYVAPFALSRSAAGWLLFGFYVVSVPLVSAARYWMRRYQLSRTRWRGIKLGLAGSGWSFAFASSGWTLLQILSLGWFTPAARINRARLLWSNARFGDQAFEFIDDGKSPQKGMWWPFALGWFAFPLAYFISLLAVFFGYAMAIGGGPMPNPSDNPVVFVLLALGAVVLMFLLMVFFWAPYNAAAMNRIASLISLDGARFRLRAKTFSLFLVSIAGILIWVFSLGFLAPLAGFLQVRYVIARLEIIGEPRFAEIGQSIVEAPRAGESLGEAFDLDMGVGVI
ncbi:MAG: DUF898 family protein [Terricaulis sp.]